MAGRKPGITPEITAAICQAIKDGNFIETSVVSAGVKKSTFYGWLSYAKRDEEAGETAETSVYIAFLEAITEALAIAELELVKQIKTSSGAGPSKNWFAAAWLLERRWPERWGKKSNDSSSGIGSKAA